MTRIAMVVVLAKEKDKSQEALRVLDHMKSKHPEVRLSQTLAGLTALVEMEGEKGHLTRLLRRSNVG